MKQVNVRPIQRISKSHYSLVRPQFLNSSTRSFFLLKHDCLKKANSYLHTPELFNELSPLCLLLLLLHNLLQVFPSLPRQQLGLTARFLGLLEGSLLGGKGQGVGIRTGVTTAVSIVVSIVMLICGDFLRQFVDLALVGEFSLDDLSGLSVVATLGFAHCAKGSCNLSA